MTYSAMFAHCR